MTYVQNTGSYAKQWWWYGEVDEATLTKLLSDKKARLTSLQAYPCRRRPDPVRRGDDLKHGRRREEMVVLCGTVFRRYRKTDQNQQCAADISAVNQIRDGKTLYAIIMIANTGADAKAWWWYLDLAPQSVESNSLRTNPAVWT